MYYVVDLIASGRLQCTFYYILHSSRALLMCSDKSVYE
jgi:hypothetical protein